MKPSLFKTVGFSIVVMSARSFVIFPLSIVFMQAASSLSANSESAGSLSSSPLFLSAPVHAKIVATEFVEVSSPLSACNSVSVLFRVLPHTHSIREGIQALMSSWQVSRMQMRSCHSLHLRRSSCMPR